MFSEKNTTSQEMTDGIDNKGLLTYDTVHSE